MGFASSKTSGTLSNSTLSPSYQKTLFLSNHRPHRLLTCLSPQQQALADLFCGVPPIGKLVKDFDFTSVSSRYRGDSLIARLYRILN